MKKINVFIFGSGSGGRSFYLRNKSNYNIKGFIDNDKNKHFSKLYGKTIFPPNDLQHLSYDLIIIASDYYSEILQQLTIDLGIDESKTVCFTDLPCTSDNFFRSVYTNFVSRCVHYFPYRLALLFKGVFSQDKNYEVREIEWLDQRDNNIIKQVFPAFDWLACGSSHYEPGKGRPPNCQKMLVLPLNLYKFNNIITSTTSRSWILDKKIIIERVSIPSINYGNYASGQITSQGKHFAITQKHFPEVIDRGIIISGISDTNYFHLLIEVLPQLTLLDTLPSELQHYPVIISEQVRRIDSIMSIIKWLNVKQDVIFIKSNKSYFFKDAILMTSPNWALPHMKFGKSFPPDVSYFRIEPLKKIISTVLNNISKPKSKLPAMILLGRKSAKRSYNQEEVINLVKCYGVHVIYLEELNISEQVNYIKNAKVILSPTGAALANLIFAREDTKVLYWMDRSHGDSSCFSNLARLMHVNLECITYEPSSSDTKASYYLPYKVDCTLIKNWLDENAIGETCNGS